MLEPLFRAIGYGLCHQLPERSFIAGGYQLPVCARDTGIYLGFVAALVVLTILSRRSRPADLPRWPVLVLIGLFVAAMGFDGVTSYLGLRATTNDIRLITGIVTGWGVATLTLPMVNSQLWAEPGVGRTPEGWRQIAVWLTAPAALYVVARWALPALGVLYPVLVTIAIWVTFTAVNVVFVALIPVFERRVRRLSDAVPVLLVAQVITVFELSGAAQLRLLLERLLLA